MKFAKYSISLEKIVHLHNSMSTLTSLNSISREREREKVCMYLSVVVALRYQRTVTREQDDKKADCCSCAFICLRWCKMNPVIKGILQITAMALKRTLNVGAGNKMGGSIFPSLASEELDLGKTC